VLGDKAYSSRAIRAHLRRRRIVATIPEPADQADNRLRRGRRGGRPPRFDAERYKQRNVVERAINKLKGHYINASFSVRGTRAAETPSAASRQGIGTRPHRGPAIVLQVNPRIQPS
jgi:hypothetical protein